MRQRLVHFFPSSDICNATSVVEIKLGPVSVNESPLASPSKRIREKPESCKRVAMGSGWRHWLLQSTAASGPV